MANRIYDPYNVKAVATTSTLIQNVSSVNWSQMAGGSPVGGDDNKWNTAIIPGMGTVSVSINCADFSPGLVLQKNYSQGVSVTFKVPQGSTGTVVFDNAVYYGDGGSMSKNGDGTVTHSFGCFSNGGATSPVTWIGAG